MARVTSTVLLICGSLLLVTWLVSPASSAPQLRASTRPQSDLGPLPPELDDVNAQVELLRLRLDRQVDFPEPARDPFRFAPSEMSVPTPVMFAQPPVPEVIRPSWPTLVAILTSAADGSLQAALSDRDEMLHVVGIGSTTGSFTVTDVSSEAVVLTDSISGQSTRLTIR